MHSLNHPWKTRRGYRKLDEPLAPTSDDPKPSHHAGHAIPLMRDDDLFHFADPQEQQQLQHHHDGRQLIMDDIISLLHQLRRKTIQWRDYPTKINNNKKDITTTLATRQIERGIVQSTIQEVNNLMQYLRTEKKSMEQQLSEFEAREREMVSSSSAEKEEPGIGSHKDEPPSDNMAEVLTQRDSIKNLSSDRNASSAGKYESEESTPAPSDEADSTLRGAQPMDTRDDQDSRGRAESLVAHEALKEPNDGKAAKENTEKVDSEDVEILSQLVLPPSSEHASLDMLEDEVFFDAKSDSDDGDEEVAAGRIQRAWRAFWKLKLAQAERVQDSPASFRETCHKSLAVRLIQAFIRGSMAREKINKKRRAAGLIQTLVRARLLLPSPKQRYKRKDEPVQRSSGGGSSSSSSVSLANKDDWMQMLAPIAGMTAVQRKVLEIAQDMRDRAQASLNRTDDTDQVPVHIEFQLHENDDMVIDLSRGPEIDEIGTAAMYIQRAWRCHSERQKFLKLVQSIVKLQSMYRGRRARESWMREQMAVRVLQHSIRSHEQKRSSAASRIQKLARDVSAKKQKESLVRAHEETRASAAIKIQKLARDAAAKKQKESTNECGCAPLVVLHPFAAEALSRNPDHFFDRPSPVNTSVPHHEPPDMTRLSHEELPPPVLLPSSYIDPSNAVAKRTKNRRFKRRLGLSRFWRKVCREAVQGDSNTTAVATSSEEPPTSTATVQRSVDPQQQHHHQQSYSEAIDYSHPTDFANVSVTPDSLMESPEDSNRRFANKPVRTVRWNLVEDPYVEEEPDASTSNVGTASPVLEAGESPSVDGGVNRANSHTSSASEDRALAPLQELHNEFLRRSILQLQSRSNPAA